MGSTPSACRYLIPRPDRATVRSGAAGVWSARAMQPLPDDDAIIKSRAEPSRAEPSRAEPSRAEPSRAEPSHSCVRVAAGRPIPSELFRAALRVRPGAPTPLTGFPDAMDEDRHGRHRRRGRPAHRLAAFAGRAAAALLLAFVALSAAVAPAGAQTVPTIASASVSSAVPSSQSGYKIGDEISVGVSFDTGVDVTGTPQLMVNVGGTQKAFSYDSFVPGSFQQILLFKYQVEEGDEDTDGFSIDANSLTLNGGTITGTNNGPNATLTHDAYSSVQLVDGVRPSLNAGWGNHEDFVLSWSEDLDFLSVPPASAFSVSVSTGSALSVDEVGVFSNLMVLELTGPAAQTAHVQFTYTPPTGMGATPIKDLAGNAALGFADRTIGNGLLNPDPPTGVAITPGPGSLTVSWNAVSRADGYRVQWKSGSEEYVFSGERYAIVSGGNITSYVISNLVPGTAYSVRVWAHRNLGGISRNYSEIDEPATPLDAAVSTVALTSDPGADGYYVAGDAIEATVTFNGPVDVAGGNPQLALEFGGSTNSAACEAGTGLTKIVCSYTVVANDGSFGVAIGANRLTLNGATIKLADTEHNAVLTHAAVPADAGHQVDTYTPAMIPGFQPAVDGTGTLVALNFDEVLSKTTALPGAFTVLVDSVRRDVTSISVNLNLINLGLASAVAHGETVTVEYADPSADDDARAVQDPAGNDVASFGPETANNLVLSGAPVVPAAPAAPALTVTGPRTIEVDWDAPADNGDAITRYVIEVSGDGTTWTTAKLTQGTFYRDETVHPGSKRHYRITAQNVHGSGPASPAASARTSGGVWIEHAPASVAEGEDIVVTLEVARDYPKLALYVIDSGGVLEQVPLRVSSYTDYEDLYRVSFISTATAWFNEGRDASGQRKVRIRTRANGRLGEGGSVTLTIHRENLNTVPTRIEPYTATVTVTDNEPPGLFVEDAEANEADGTMDFRVGLKRSHSGSVTVDYATADRTATAGTDYTAVSDTLTFAPGETEKTVSVPILADAVADDGEWFALTLTGSSGARIVDGEGLGTIRDPSPAASGPLTGFWLADGPSGRSLGRIVDGAVLTLPDPHGTYQIGPRKTAADGIGSVRFVLSGPKNLTRTDSYKGFGLFDQPGQTLPGGDYTLSATAYAEEGARGDVLGTLTVSFTVAASSVAAGTALSGLTLTNKTIGGVSAIGDGDDEDGTVFPRTAGHRYEFAAAVTEADVLGSVHLELFGPLTAQRTENAAPYELFAGAGGELPAGVYTLRAIAYGNADRGGSVLQVLTRTFTLGALTASFEQAPDTHEGNAFTVRLRFSEAVDVSDEALKSALAVTGGTIVSVGRAAGGAALREVRIQPTDSVTDVTVSLAETTDCAVAGAVCTHEGLMLSEAASHKVPALITVSVADVVGTEGGTADFKVRLNKASDRQVTVKYKTVQGEAIHSNAATEGDDYTAVDSTLTFAVGDTEKTVSVSLKAESPPEADDDEVFWLVLSNATGARLIEHQNPAVREAVTGDDDPAVARATIRDANSAAASTLKVYSATAREGRSDLMTFPVLLDPAVKGTVTVDYATGDQDDTATAGADYQAVSGTLTFSATQVLKLVQVPIIDDAHEDSGETFTLTLRNPSGATLEIATATGTILNHDAPALSVAAAQALEADGALAFVVTLDRAAGETVRVSYATLDGTARSGEDYTATEGVLEFLAGETEKTVTVPVAADEVEESDETLTLLLSDATGAGIAQGVATGTIRETALAVNTAPTGVPTIAGTARVGETLTASVDGIEDADGLENAAFAWQWLSNDGNADTEIEDADEAAYRPAAADVGKTLKVRVTFTDDGGTEETVVSAATAPVAAALPEIAVRAVSEYVAEGGAAVFALSRTGDVSAALTVSVAVTAEGAALESAAPAGAVFASGARTVEVSLATADDETPGSDGAVTLAVAAGTGYAVAADHGSATVTVLEDDAAPAPAAAGEVVLWSATMTVSDNTGGSVGGNHAGAFTGVSAPGGFRVRSMSYTASTATLRVRMTGTLPEAEGLALHAGGRTLADPRMKVVSKHFGAVVTFTVNDLDWATGQRVAVRFVQRSTDAAASDAALASLGLGDAALAPAFEADRLVYAASVDAGTESVTVTAAARDGDAEVALEPGDADTGTDGHQVALGAGETLVTARVTAADGVTVRAYRVVVTRAEAEAETGPVAAALSVGGAAAEPGRFQVRAAFGAAVTGFALDDLSALRVGDDAAAVSDLVEAETGRAWTAWVAAAQAGRYVVRLGAGAAQAGARESAAAVLVADVDTQGNAAAVAGPAVAAVTVVAPAAGSWTAGDDIEVTLRFTEAVTVDTAGGTPTVGLTVGGNARSAAYASGSGTAALAFAYRVAAGDGTVSAVAATENSLALAGGTIRGGAESDADLAHPGAELTLSAPQVVAPTAAFSGLPQAHDGETAFSLSLAFSEEVAADAATLQGGNGEPGALTVAGGTVERLVQVEPGSSRHWTLRIEPDGEDTVTVTLAAIADCAAGNAVCTGDGRALAGGVSGAVPGPSATVPPATDALTAAFREMPATHGGPGSEAFTFQVLFSESIKVSYRVLGGPDAFDVTGGSVSRSWRVNGRDELRGVAVQPAGWDDVTVTLAPTASCDEDGAICTADGRRLSGTETATVRGPVAIDVADATVTEGPGATLDFVVTLSRASSETVTVDYATADGTAKAGEDYTNTEGTLSFAAGVTERTVAVPVLDDAVDDGGETMKLLLSDAEGARIRDGEAIGTIENSDAIPQAWLARFGRTVADHVVDAVGSRFADPRGGGSHVTLGGKRIALDGAGGGAAPEALAEREAAQGLASFAERMAGASDDGAPGANAWTLREEDGLAGSTETMSERELLLGSSFHLALGAGGEDTVAGDTRWTAWGRAASSRFDGEADGLRLDGEVTTFTLGADAAWSRWLAGVAVSLSEGAGSYRDQGDGDRGSGELESSLTGVHPYARLELSERLSLWGVLGFGSGALTLEMDGKDGERFTTDTGQEMAAVGARGVLVAAPAAGGLELAVRTDAVMQRMTSSAATGPGGGNLAGTHAQTSRVRLMLEGSHAIAVGEAGRLVPTLEVGLRQDGGDAETGTGIEMGAGLRWTDPATGLAVEAKLRGLVAHEDADYSEWGASGSVRIEPGADGRGLSLTLAPAWGAVEGGAERLWSHRDARAFAPENETQAGSRLEAELGYGFSVLGGRAVATPWAGMTRSETGETLRLGQRLKMGPSEWRLETEFADDSRRYGAGWGYRLGGALDLTVEAMRREAANDDAPEHEAMLRARMRW